MTPTPEQLLQRGAFGLAGQGFERAGVLDRALDAYTRGRLWADASRILAKQGQHLPAAHMLLRVLPRRNTDASTLPPNVRRALGEAAMQFHRAGALAPAVGLLEAVGDRQRAAELLQRAGRGGEARAVQQGEHYAASPWPAGVVYPLEGRRTPGRAPTPASTTRVGAPTPTGTTRAHAPQRPVRSMPGPKPPRPPVSAVATHSPSPPSAPLRATGRADVTRGQPRPGRPALARGEQPAGGSTTHMGRTAVGATAVGRTRASAGGGSWEGEAPAAPPDHRPAPAARDPMSDSSAIDLERRLRALWSRPRGRLEETSLKLLSDWVGQEKPRRVDLPLFFAAGRLCEYHDHIEVALQWLRAILRVAPGYRGVADRVEELAAGRVERRDGVWQEASRLAADRRSALPPLDDLLRRGRTPVGTYTVGATAAAAAQGQARIEAGGAADDLTIDAAKLTARGATHIGDDDTIDVAEYQRRMPSTDGETMEVGEYQDRIAAAGGARLEDGSLRPGTVVAGRFQVRSMLGKGGMATVYRALDTEREEEVALKLFLAEDGGDGLRRFRQEMKVSRDLVHPNIVRIYEFGAHQGARYITMEVMDGQDLDVLLQERGRPLAVRQVLRLMIQACDGIGHAHSKGVIHRDIKPANLFVVDNERTLKVMDFGIAKANEGLNATKGDSRVGTPRYMAPEQIKGEGGLTEATDLYALGGVMYELITGRHVFDSEDLVRLLFCHLNEAPVPLRERRPDLDIPQPVEAIVMRLLAKDQGDRHPSALALKKDLLGALVGLERL